MKWDLGTTPPSVTIKVDSDQAGRIKLVIHELLHFILNEILDLESKLIEPLEEEIVEAVAEEVWEYVDSDARRLKWWREAVLQKTAV